MDADKPGESAESEPVLLLRQLFHLEGKEQNIKALLGNVYDGWQLPAPCLPYLIGSGYALMFLDALLLKGGALYGAGALVSFIGLCTAVETFWWNRRRTQQAALERIAQHNSVAEIGLLIEAFFWGRRDVQKAVTTALLHLLPRMRASDAGSLTEHQRECLYAALDTPNVDLTLALLAAFEQVGDYRALPHVEALAQETSKAAQRDRRILEAAQACLPYLRQEAERVKGAQSLLRPSSIADVMSNDLVRSAEPPSENLVRPAQDPGETAPELLLRPHE